MVLHHLTILPLRCALITVITINTIHLETIPTQFIRYMYFDSCYSPPVFAMAETKKPYGWFDLPPEIRNMIVSATTLGCIVSNLAALTQFFGFQYREALSAPDSEQDILPPLLPPLSRRLLSSDTSMYLDMFIKRFERKERLRRLKKQPRPLAVSLLRVSKRF